MSKTDTSDTPSILQMTFVLLTYKTHLDKQSYTQWAQSQWKVKAINIAHETGGEGSYDHTHVVIRFAARLKVRSSSLRVFDYEDIHPNIKVLPGLKAYKDALEYISKEDSSATEGSEVSLCDQVWACESLEDALSKFVLRPSDVPGIIALYNVKPRQSAWNPIELIEWQIPFYETIKDANSSRDVYWIRSDGNSGKTYFMKYMMQQHPKDTVLITDAYMTKDVSLILKGALDDGNSGKYMFFDCARAFTFPDQFYQLLERVKDGLITSTKYHSSTLMFQNSVLVVMSNQWPDLSKLTMDRWKLFEIEDNQIFERDVSVADTSYSKFAMCYVGTSDPYSHKYEDWE